MCQRGSGRIGDQADNGRHRNIARRQGDGVIGALIVIGGSTASGKSALALALAERLGGVIVNADSQQLFADLPILTARPSAADEARAHHRLYGVLGPREQPSAGRWLELVAPVLEELRATGRAAILTGGTGLYLHALLRGIAAMPPVPAALRERLRAESEGVPAALLHERLRAGDPVMAARLEPGDRQRILRALEILEATGRSLAYWQAQGRRERLELPPVLASIALVPPAALVARRIETRFEAMLQAGVLDEVAALAERCPDAARQPIAKVHGLRELLALREGRLEERTARERINAQIRQYAKRQRTWFRHQLPELRALETVGEDPALAAALLVQIAEAGAGQG
ncbi:tRNA (adenosine(37)-N6)-dimethylallyltransferase MiaA [Geminicoccaceae bacterium 1502E]|nr:tRNA (adenosine(37)-N6)-dimethylallyltransferase MiaA [Geminicoccaceae bacterium 1502E]